MSTQPKQEASRSRPDPRMLQQLELLRNLGMLEMMVKLGIDKMQALPPDATKRQSERKK